MVLSDICCLRSLDTRLGYRAMTLMGSRERRGGGKDRGSRVSQHQVKAWGYDTQGSSGGGGGGGITVGRGGGEPRSRLRSDQGERVMLFPTFFVVLEQLLKLVQLELMECQSPQDLRATMGSLLWVLQSAPGMGCGRGERKRSKI